MGAQRQGSTTRGRRSARISVAAGTDLSFDDDWFPARAKLYVTHTPAMDGGRDVLISIDPAYPNRWREAPYYDRILQIAAKRGRVVVSVGSQVFTLRRAPAS